LRDRGIAGITESAGLNSHNVPFRVPVNGEIGGAESCGLRGRLDKPITHHVSRPMPFSMRSFIVWSGIYNAGLAAVLLCPPAYQLLGLNICSPVWGWLIAGFLAFTAAVLILSARDLPARASFVYWESLLRYVAALLLIPAGLFGDIGIVAALLGLGDLLIGLVYMFGLPRELGRAHADLLLDRVSNRVS
jgi:hypothetical protein